jgi:hypothetical protein
MRYYNLPWINFGGPEIATNVCGHDKIAKIGNKINNNSKKLRRKNS